jgi:hypothetical protein
MNSLGRASRWRLAHLPTRLSAGGFLLTTGTAKWAGGEAVAAKVHKLACEAYPFLVHVDPARFLRLLAGTEIAVAAALLVPRVPGRLAGASLSALALGLLGLYARSPAMHDGIRPTDEGIAVAKDVWLLGIGAGLILDDMGI